MTPRILVTGLRSRRVLIGPALALGLLMALIWMGRVYAVHAVTPGASVDVDVDTVGAGYTALNNVVFTDPPDLAATNTFTLTAPAGFEFNPAAAADQAIGAGYATTQIDLGVGAGVAAAPLVYTGGTRARPGP